MSDYDVDVDVDDLDLDDTSADTSTSVTTPDPLDTADVDDGSLAGDTVEFEDGTTVTSPHEDALGYVYKSTDDWIAGTDKHVVDE